MKKWKTLVLSVTVILMALFLSICVYSWINFNFFAWNALAPGTQIVESVSPDHKLVARVTAGDKKGEYLLEIKQLNGKQGIASKKFSAPIGYHEHLITLRWEKQSKRVVAVIDHDFGDGKLEVPLGL